VLERYGEEAKRIVREALVWDNHACMPLRPEDHSFLPQLFDVHASGVDIVSLNAGFGPTPLSLHLDMLESFHRWIDSNTARVRLVRTVADIDAARREGKLGVMFDVEGMGPLDGGRIDLVERFRRDGVGWMLVAYNRSNDAGAGIYDPDHGLTTYGKEVLAEMKRVGMIACCSHTGHRTAMDVMNHAGNPVIFSHSNASAVYAHERNIPDALIKACAETGGVIGVNGLGHFLGDNDASPQRVAEHLDYIVQQVGPLHAGIGLDFVYDQAEFAEYLAKLRETFPDDASLPSTPNMLPATEMDALVAHLLGRGYKRDDVEAILGGNWRRVANSVWCYN
jgi:membrane dipeptidase